jgi:hypothetical protein
MNDAPGVGVGNRPRQHLDHPGGVAGLLRPAAEVLRQGATCDVFEAEKGQAVVLADLEHLHDVRVR